MKRVIQRVAVVFQKPELLSLPVERTWDCSNNAVRASPGSTEGRWRKAREVHAMAYSDSNRHVAQFYQDDAFLLDQLSVFIRSAIESGGAAVVFAKKSHRDGLKKRLQKRGCDVHAAARQGPYIALDAARALSELMVDNAPEAEQFTRRVDGAVMRMRTAATGKQPRVAVFRGIVALLVAQGKADAALRLQQFWNDLAQTHSFNLLYSFSMKGFNREADETPLLKIFAGHSSVLPDETSNSRASEGDRLRNITPLLQQKARLLEKETTERKEAQESLRQRKSELAETTRNIAEGLKPYAVGAKIRELRLKKSMGLIELGKNSGLSPSMLSKLERGKLLPTLPTLLRIAMVFRVGLGHFFDERKRQIVSIVRNQERPLSERRKSGKSAYFQMLDFKVPPDRGLNAYIADFNGEVEKATTHPGFEFLYLIRGKLCLTIGSDVHTLSVGDSIYFDSGLRHSYRRIGKQPNTAIVVTLP